MATQLKVFQTVTFVKIFEKHLQPSVTFCVPMDLFTLKKLRSHHSRLPQRSQPVGKKLVMRKYSWSICNQRQKCFVRIALLCVYVYACIFLCVCAFVRACVRECVFTYCTVTLTSIKHISRSVIFLRTIFKISFVFHR